ncbi:MAG: potassium transporter KtrB [Candidatus Cloacimonetes bacterium]|nr:potassium transporter KtrB [Candidatus Cloacimonadota bacterium]MCF7813323.1 potassium transporter KtrB [Candidatus Cloacimonadota bacterium]MCF7867812.1 potassium transporter KtrB [Candidatus Cloacimonadota bacterium]MCF7883302.1 potassium transporter KtrB [Candidatus Cloacimonadota bacterium]
MKLVKIHLSNRRPEISLFLGYLSYVIFGYIFLSFAFCRNINIPGIDTLFTVVSAISTTGLSTVNIGADYNFWGQLGILILIQLGGIGYMTFGSFIVLSVKRRLSQNRKSIHATAFSLPKDFSIKKFISSIVIYTFIIELIGVYFLYTAFQYDDRANVLWSSVFHSISAFCTAGFSLYPNSFESYANTPYLNIVIFCLSFLGAIGYIVMVDVWLVLKGKKSSITFTSKIILSTSIILLIFGTFSIFFDFLLHSKTVLNQSNTFLQSFFQTMTSLTTVGFNTIPINELRSSSLFIISLLMIIGASPSGTGGGIKSTTVSALFGILGSLFSKNKEYIKYNNKRDFLKKEKKNSNAFLRMFLTSKQEKIKEETKNDNDKFDSIFGEVFKIKLMNRTIPYDRVLHAVASFIFYVIILSIGFLLLLLTESFSFEELFFESASALGTVGLSMGITGGLTGIGKFITIILMFIGRIGPITFGIVLFNRDFNKSKEYEDIVI